MVKTSLYAAGVRARVEHPFAVLQQMGGKTAEKRPLRSKKSEDGERNAAQTSSISSVQYANGWGNAWQTWFLEIPNRVHLICH